MTRTLWAISIPTLMALAAGCTSSYRVDINGYSELNEPIDRTEPMYVATDPNSPNLIFQRQIKAKAERLLRDEGYTVALTPEKAAYEIAFRVGRVSREIVDNSPVVNVRSGFYGGYGRHYGFGPMMYMPYYDTEYRQWLVLRLFKLGATPSEAKKLVWVGEAAMETEREAIRQAVNYLLVACIDSLGADTGEEVTVKIERDDPRILEIEGER